ncbi:hypothetical protein Glove_23g223 [Diversispora epigaea]|uniref:Protein kinase domain-containing protein n=1 Tax=Diversispora epigaea TaxID=1348612 RepID=A0A397JQT2_9GLOM|nr:hypothetical protein Glove_23g223 [Diversispora epigaea]
MTSNKKFVVFGNEINDNSNDNLRKYRQIPTLFGRNQIGKHSYTVKIVCSIPSFDFATANNNNKKNNNNNNVKKVKFSNFIKTSEAIGEYDRAGQLGQKEENFEIDIWFTGETLAKTKFNMGKWVNKNIYNHQEVSVSLKKINRYIMNSKNTIDECRIWDNTRKIALNTFYCYLIAPELLIGDEEYTKAADIYSYGIIACEIITGFPPYPDISHDKDLAMKIYSEIGIQIKKAEEFSANQESTNTTTTSPPNYQTHPQAIYTSRLLNYSNLPKPKNEENFERELEESTKSMSDLCPIFLILQNLNTRDRENNNKGDINLSRNRLKELKHNISTI